MDDENARLASDLRQRMNRKARVILGLSLLGLGMPVGAAWLVLVLTLRLPALYAGALAGALVLLVALASFGLAHLQRSRGRRSLALIALADELGLAFQEVAAPGLAEGLRKLEMFGSASGIAASNVLSGQVEGLAMTVMDCVVAAGQANFESTALVLRNVPRRVPDFHLTPRDFFSRGELAVEIPGQADFNKRFVLKGEDAQVLRRAFDAQVIELCLAGANQNVEVSRPLFVVMRRGGLVPPGQYQPFLVNCVRLAKALGVAGTA